MAATCTSYTVAGVRAVRLIDAVAVLIVVHVPPVGRYCTVYDEAGATADQLIVAVVVAILLAATFVGRVQACNISKPSLLLVVVKPAPLVALMLI